MTPEQFTQLLEAIREANSILALQNAGIGAVLLMIFFAIISRK